MKSYLRSNRMAFILSLIYFIPATIWVFLSDSWLFDPAASPAEDRLRRIDMYKDASFVVAVSIAIFFMTRISRKKLSDTRQQYQNLFDKHPQPMWIYDTETLRFLAVNTAAVQQYGYTREEFLRMNLKDIRPIDEVSVLNKYMSAYKPGENRYGLWNHKKKNGDIIIVEIAANDVVFFRKPCRLVCATDVTEKIRKDADIGKLSMVAENATNSVIILDNQARIEWVNASFTKLTGYSLEEVIGKSPSSFLHGPDTEEHVRDRIMKSVMEGKSYTGEVLNYHKNGSKFWLRLTVSPVYTNGRLSNYVTIQTDITEIKEQNDRLRDIAVTASHGFRKPLANILGLVNLIDETDNQREVIDNIKSSAQELDREVKVIVDKTAMIK